MKRTVAVSILLVLVWAAAGAQATKPMFPWQSPNPDGTIAAAPIAVGFFMDAVGIGLFAGSSAATGNLGVMVGLYSGGCVLLGTGSFVMNLGTERRQRGLEGMGYTITETRRSLSRTLSWITLGCEAGALIVTMAVGDTLGGAIASIVIGGVGATVEVVNLYGPRRTWLSEINGSIDGKSPGLSSRIRWVTPVVTLGARPYLGLSLGL